MAARRLNPRLAKKYRLYTVEETAALFGKHKNTIRSWIKQGLATTDQKRPSLLRGQDISDFLGAKGKAKKQKCRPGEMFCVACKAPRQPDGNIAEYLPRTESSGMLRGICPVCANLIHRVTSKKRLLENIGLLEVTGEGLEPHIIERT